MCLDFLSTKKLLKILFSEEWLATLYSFANGNSTTQPLTRPEVYLDAICSSF